MRITAKFQLGDCDQGPQIKLNFGRYGFGIDLVREYPLPANAKIDCRGLHAPYQDGVGIVVPIIAGPEGLIVHDNWGATLMKDNERTIRRFATPVELLVAYLAVTANLASPVLPFDGSYA